MIWPTGDYEYYLSEKCQDHPLQELPGRIMVWVQVLVHVGVTSQHSRFPAPHDKVTALEYRTRVQYGTRTPMWK